MHEKGSVKNKNQLIMQKQLIIKLNPTVFMQ